MKSKSDIKIIDNCIVMQKEIGDLKASELTQEIAKFVRTDLKIFELYVSRKICEIFEKHGLVISTNPTKEDVEKITNFKVRVDIIDCHAKSKELIVYRKEKQTIIYYDNMLEVANEIKVYER